jgi:hypothetical protein
MPHSHRKSLPRVYLKVAKPANRQLRKPIVGARFGRNTAEHVTQQVAAAVELAML